MYAREAWRAAGANSMKYAAIPRSTTRPTERPSASEIHVMTRSSVMLPRSSRRDHSDSSGGCRFHSQLSMPMPPLAARRCAPVACRWRHRARRCAA